MAAWFVGSSEGVYNFSSCVHVPQRAASEALNWSPAELKL